MTQVPYMRVLAVSSSGDSHRQLTPNALEKYPDTPPISIVILSQKKHALFCAESSTYINQCVSSYGSHLNRNARRLKVTQCRTGVWKYLRSLPAGSSPSTGYNFWTHGCTIFTQYWAAVCKPHRESAILPSTGTG